MNRKRKIKQMRKFISEYGVVTQEYKRPKDLYYRKGSYFVNFDSKLMELRSSVGDVDKYHVYKTIVNDIKTYIKNTL